MKIRVAFLILPLGFLVGVPSPGLGADPPPHVNFADPARQYAPERKDDWKLMIEQSLVDKSPDVADRAVARLVANLDKLMTILPPSSLDSFRHLTYFVMEGPDAPGGGRNNGLEYFQDKAPSFHPEVDPRWSSAVVVYSAQNYIDITDLWAMKSLMHELAHAYQLERWPEKEPHILSAWQNAVASGLYRNVKDVDGETRESAYALTNQLEYFAELSACYFVGINYEPYDRSGLKSYDPVGYEMIEDRWNTSDETTAR